MPRLVDVAASRRLLVSDSFDRADNTTSLGSADTGQAWTAHSGTWGITGGRASQDAAGGEGTAVTATLDSGLANGLVQATMSVLGANPTRLVFRYVDESNHFIVSNQGGGWTIYRYQASSYTAVDTYITTAANGDVLEVALNGSSIRLWVNNVFAFGATDTFQTTATRHGFQCANAATRCDNFSIRAL